MKKGKEELVFLVKIVLGRGTVLQNPLQADLPHQIISVEDKRNNHGIMIDVILAIKKFGVYYRAIQMPDNSLREGSIFFDRSYQEIPADDQLGKGMVEILNQIDLNVQKLIRDFQEPVPVLVKRLKRKVSI